MLNWLPRTILRHLHLSVLAVFVFGLFGPANGLAGPVSLFMNLPVSTDSEEEKGENEREREGVEQAEALWPPGNSLRRNLSRYMAPPPGRASTVPSRRQSPQPSRFIADPARDLIASGSGLFQRC